MPIFRQRGCLLSRSWNIYKTSARLINELDKVTGYKIYTQKPTVFLYNFYILAANNWKWNLKYIFHLQEHQKQLEINLTIDMKIFSLKTTEQHNSVEIREIQKKKKT